MPSCDRCAGGSKTFLHAINTFVIFIAIFVLVAALLLALQNGDLIAGLGQVGLVGGAAAGGLLLFTGILGCIGTCYNRKCLLFIYMILMLALSTLTLGVGVILVAFVDDVNNVDGAASEDFAGQVEGQINDYIVAVFNECCSDEFLLEERIRACNDALLVDGDPCFTFVDTYQDALERIRNTGVCEVLENQELVIDGEATPLVGDPEIAGGCANGSAVVFLEEFSDKVADIVEPSGIFFTTVGSLLLIATFASLIIICAERDTDEFDFNSNKKADKYYGNGYNAKSISGYDSYGRR